MKKNPQESSQGKGLPEAIVDLSRLLKFENMNPNTERFSLLERNVYGGLSAYKHICDEKKTSQVNHYGHISEKVIPPQEEPQAGP